MRHEETVCLCLSDLHYGASTPSYDSEICRRRLDAVADRIASIHAQMSAGSAFDRLVVFLLGDVVDGSGIYSSQAHHQDVTNPEQQVREAAALLKDFLLRMKAVFGAVECFSVAGNHGRYAGEGMHEAANHDIACHRMLNLLVAPHGINVHVNDVEPFRHVVRIRGHGVLLHHGHFVRAGAFPITSIMRRLLYWQSADTIPDFTVACLGHFHSIGYWKHNRVKLLMSGTMKTDDAWALDTLGLESAANWWLFGVSDSHCPSWQFALELDHRKMRGAIPPDDKRQPMEPEKWVDRGGLQPLPAATKAHLKRVAAIEGDCPLDDDLLQPSPVKDPTGSVRQALVEERGGSFSPPPLRSRNITITCAFKPCSKTRTFANYDSQKFCSLSCSARYGAAKRAGSAA